MKIEICDICRDELKEKYQFDITKQTKKDKTVYDGLVSVEICQKCFLRLEKEVNRMKKLSQKG